MKNTEQCANISLVSTKIQDGIKNSAEFLINGSFYKRDETYYVTYTEPEETGLGNTRVVIKISEKCVYMHRMGEYKTAVQYEEDRITDTVYKTPFGSVDIKIKTTRIDNMLTEKGGTLKIFYSLITGGENIENEISLVIKLRSDKNED